MKTNIKENIKENTKENIIFIINSIGSGGAETALFNIINAAPEYIKKKAIIHLVILDIEPILKDIPKNIRVHQLDSKRSLVKSVMQCFRLFRQIKPSITISFLVRANIVNSILRIVRNSPKSIICERMHLSSHLKSQYSGVKASVAAILPKSLYRFNELVLGVSSGVTADLATCYNIPVHKLKTIYNPYNIDLIIQNSKKTVSQLPVLPDKFMVTVGRLTKSKDQQTLIRGFAEANTKLHLVIIGVGDLRSDLERLAAELNVQDRVIFLGYVNNPYAVISKAEYFISTSNNEGFPNALMESMVLGKPTIFSCCESGPAEIMGEHHTTKVEKVTFCEYGVLIPEGMVKETKNAIEVFEHEQHRLHYEKQSIERSKHFTLTTIANQYWDEISTLIA